MMDPYGGRLQRVDDLPQLTPDALERRIGGGPADERVVRFLVVPPERTELVRAKLEQSPLLRSIVEEQNWHVLKWNHARTFAALGEPTLERFLGLDPIVERAGEQLPLFEPPDEAPADAGTVAATS